MLSLSRSVRESIRLLDTNGHTIARIFLSKILSKDSAKLAIDAERDVVILREEVYERQERDKATAAKVLQRMAEQAKREEIDE